MNEVSDDRSNELGRCDTPFGKAIAVRGVYDNESLAVELLDEEDGELIECLSINLPQFTQRLGKDEFFVKDWDVNETLIRPALASGLFENTGRTSPRTGFGRYVPIWRILSQKKP